jgi:hypothetical protein
MYMWSEIRWEVHGTPRVLLSFCCCLGQTRVVTVVTGSPPSCISVRGSPSSPLSSFFFRVSFFSMTSFRFPSSYRGPVRLTSRSFKFSPRYSYRRSSFYKRRPGLRFYRKSPSFPRRRQLRPYARRRAAYPSPYRYSQLSKGDPSVVLDIYTSDVRRSSLLLCSN